jgi:NADPH-dependent glutamate synthase beta subunit-like oxidoreductase
MPVDVASVDPVSGLKPVSRNWLQTNLPCQSACPVGTHAGGYVSMISKGLYREAYLLARRPNPFASVCGRICAHPCEAACRRQFIDESISIRALKRFVTEHHGVESDATFEEILEVVERPRPEVRDGGRVAVVGAGPAGLACAHDLVLMGHRVVVFDSAPVAGGMMRLGIPEYRLPRELIQKEIDFIAFIGVEIQLGVEIGKDIHFEQMREEYDAVFLAPGCRRGRSLKIPGMDLGGVITAVDFLVSANLGHPLDIGEQVLVVGGGNVAFDVARTARRFGGTSVPDESHHNLMFDAALTAARTLNKRVTMVSLEGRDEMPADLEEIEEGQREGITLIHRRGPKAVVGANGRARALQTIDCMRVFDEQGRFSPQFAEGTEKEIACDTVIFAIGQIADLSFLGNDHGLQVTPQNTLAVERETLATSQPGIYAGGDVAFGPRIVIEAVADGRRAARAIDTHLTGRSDEPTELVLRRFDTFGYEHPFAAGDYERLQRGEIQTIAVEERAPGAEVEVSYSNEQARVEGARCLHCWVNTIFDSRAMSGSECIQCGGCADVCPEDCIDLVSLLRVHRVGEASLEQPLRLPDGGPLQLAGAALIKDETACIRCGLCARRCPVGCITMQGFYRQEDAELLKQCETSF